MKRMAHAFLREWLTRKDRKPLIVRGARQVGKSTLVRNFADDMHLDLVELNLEQHKLTRFWESNRADIILREIEILTNKRITGEDLLFIDEIQEIPAAIASSRYLYE